MQHNNDSNLLNPVANKSGEFQVSVGTNKSGELQISVAANNRLEALKVLSQSILKEVDSLRREENIAESPKINLAEEVQNYEADLIRCALLRCGGKQRRAAKLLGVKVTTLNSKIKRLGVELMPSHNLRG